LALPAWNPNWDNDSDFGGTEETKDDVSLIVDETAVADMDVNVHTAEAVNTDGSNSPPSCPYLLPPRLSWLIPPPLRTTM